MTIDEQLKQANTNFLRTSAALCNTIQEMERDLTRMREKKLPQDLIDQKDNQIEQLANYYNQVDELVSFYKLLNTNLKVQLAEACTYIVRAAQDEQVQQKYLMQYLTINTASKNV